MHPIALTIQNHGSRVETVAYLKSIHYGDAITLELGRD
jgi:hypothetical protein